MSHIENETDQRLAAIEKQLAALLSLIGGKRNDEQSTIPVSNATPTQSAPSADWG